MTFEELKQHLADLQERTLRVEPSYYCRDGRYDNLSWAKRARWYGGTSALWKR